MIIPRDESPILGAREFDGLEWAAAIQALHPSELNKYVLDIGRETLERQRAASALGRRRGEEWR